MQPRSVIHIFYVKMKPSLSSSGWALGLYIVYKVGNNFQSKLKVRRKFGRRRNLERKFGKLKAIIYMQIYNFSNDGRLTECHISSRKSVNVIILSSVKERIILSSSHHKKGHITRSLCLGFFSFDTKLKVSYVSFSFPFCVFDIFVEQKVSIMIST